MVTHYTVITGDIFYEYQLNFWEWRFSLLFLIICSPDFPSMGHSTFLCVSQLVYADRNTEKARAGGGLNSMEFQGWGRQDFSCETSE